MDDDGLDRALERIDADLAVQIQEWSAIFRLEQRLRRYRGLAVVAAAGWAAWGAIAAPRGWGLAVLGVNLAASLVLYLYVRHARRDLRQRVREMG